MPKRARSRCKRNEWVIGSLGYGEAASAVAPVDPASFSAQSVVALT